MKWYCINDMALDYRSEEPYWAMRSDVEKLQEDHDKLQAQLDRLQTKIKVLREQRNRGIKAVVNGGCPGHLDDSTCGGACESCVSHYVMEGE